MLAFAVAEQNFEAVTGRDAEIVESPGHIELAEFAAGNVLDRGRNLPAPTFAVQDLGLCAAEGQNHAAEVTRRGTTIKTQTS